MKTTFLFLIISFFSFLSVFSQSLTEADNQRKIMYEQCKYDSVLFYAEEAAAIALGISGENSLEYAESLRGLVMAHYHLGNYSKARFYGQKEIKIRENIGATKDDKYINALVNTVVISSKMGFYNDAIDLMKRTKIKAAKIYEQESPEYAGILVNMGCVYNDLGCSVNDKIFLKNAEEFFLQAENIYNKNEKKKIENLVNKLNQAVHKNNQGNGPASEILFSDAVTTSEKEFGSTSYNYACALNDLGVFNYNKGSYMQAEKYFTKTLDILKNANNKDKILKAICISNSAAMLYDLGNYTTAAEKFIEAKQILEEYHLQNHRYYAILLNNLAITYISEYYYANIEDKNQEQFLNSGKLFLQADSIFNLNCQMPQPDGFIIKTNIGLWYKLNGESKKSIKHITDLVLQSNLSAYNPVSLIKKMNISAGISFDNTTSQSIIEPVMISVSTKINDHFINDEQLEVNSQTNVASTQFIIRLMIGKRTKIKKALGQYHPAYAELLKGLIPLYRSIGDFKMEEMMTLECLKAFNHNMVQDFSFLTESEKEIYMKVKMNEINSFLGYFLERREKNPEITGYAYDFILQNKGLMLKSSTAMRASILNSNNKELLAKYDEWIRLQKEISSLYSLPVEMRTKDVAIVEKEATSIEKQLVQSSQVFNDYTQTLRMNWKNVKDSLKSNEAAIEYIHFRIKDKEKVFRTYYCAMILRKNSEYPEMIKLFEENELQTIIVSNHNNYTSINNIYGTENKPDNRLYQLIWKPVESLLSGVNKVYISPSGLLLKISFSSICTQKDVYLCDKLDIQTKGSTGNSAPRNVFSTTADLSALIFGGIKYGVDSTKSGIWNYLEGTGNEGDAIRNILEKEQVNVKYLTDIKATETFLKQNAGNYNILHVATHGFSFPDPAELHSAAVDLPEEYGSIAFRGAARGIGVSSFVENQNPLMRSGLVFAGANEVWNKTEISETDDGVLTAQEVTQMDMRNSFLAVLSACETGLGDIKGNEGAYGLQRAFKMAGVKYIIMSLWQVPDKETQEFMTAFYAKLIKTKDIREAFTETQKEMRKKYDPYFWGAFVLVE
ncbi:MAG: hypothetical protein A2W91_11220 [Bacteroidetes bacterium GWF2_38_335]|nr:MAG: hypothetical protein A2W91_11220 [Bacteroidetes bacterium GWF2_38_335]OFY81733.1 MAG: hypothetical protein A2281_05820 [Bacteroidetes bacterium RIFOXYA12_FULL_38_20]HBS87797.1 hypothetical protein [Bacteroidales bacterium]